GGKQTLSISRDAVIKPWSLAKFESLVVAADPVSTNAPSNGGLSERPMKPTAVISVGGTIGNLTLSTNRKWLFFLNRTSNQLVQVDAATLKAARTWDLPAGCETFALTPDGKSIFTSGGESGQSHVFELDPITLQVQQRFRIDAAAYDLAATDGGLIFLGG